MNFNEYQRAAMTTAIFPNAGDDLVYPALGLAGEAGEVAGKVKKLIRDNKVYFGVDVPEDKRKALIAELGDCLWYLAVLASTLGISLEDLAEKNVAKLLSRKERGVIQGSGDER